MAIFIIKDAVATFNGVDLSDHITQVAVEMTAEDVQTNAMVASGEALGTRRVQGMRDDQFTVTFHSDFAAGEVDDTLWPLFREGTSFEIEVKPFDTTVGEGNPKFVGTVIMTSYQPVSGEVGSLATTDVTFPVDGTIERYETDAS